MSETQAKILAYIGVFFVLGLIILFSYGAKEVFAIGAYIGALFANISFQVGLMNLIFFRRVPISKGYFSFISFFAIILNMVGWFKFPYALKVVGIISLILSAVIFIGMVLTRFFSTKIRTK